MAKDWAEESSRMRGAAASERSLSRRELLKIVVGTAGAPVSLPRAVLAAKAAPPVGHAVIPAGAAKPAYVPRFFNEATLRSIAALAETVIPTDSHSRGAEAAGVQEFIDDRIADSDSKTQALWRDGLATLENVSGVQFGKGVEALSAEERAMLLEKFASAETNPATLEERFFVALKRATVEGYYTSSVGIHEDLNYQGNAALAEFPGCKH